MIVDFSRSLRCTVVFAEFWPPLSLADLPQRDATKHPLDDSFSKKHTFWVSKKLDTTFRKRVLIRVFLIQLGKGGHTTKTSCVLYFNPYHGIQHLLINRSCHLAKIGSLFFKQRVPI